MGHEFCGEIAAVSPLPVGEGLGAGADDATWRIGDRVVCNALVPCGQCVRCQRGDPHLCAQRQVFGMNRPGAFAEYVNVPLRALIPWPAGMPAEHAALAEPLGNGVHIVNLVKDLRPQTVLVIGAGPIGLLAQQAFQALLGATTYAADLSDERLAVAARVGATQTFNPRSTDVVQAVRDLTGGEGVDVVVDAVGAGVTKKQAVQAARPGGAAVWIGLHENVVNDFATYDVTLPEKRVFGTYAAKLDEMQTALDLMAAGKVDVTGWPEAFPLDRGEEAFRRMLAAQGKDIKAVIKP
jgi:L-iditol 2-dehydrogenase